MSTSSATRNEDSGNQFLGSLPALTSRILALLQFIFERSVIDLPRHSSSHMEALGHVGAGTNDAFPHQSATSASKTTTTTTSRMTAMSNEEGAISFSNVAFTFPHIVLHVEEQQVSSPLVSSGKKKAREEGHGTAVAATNAAVEKAEDDRKQKKRDASPVPAATTCCRSVLFHNMTEILCTTAIHNAFLQYFYLRALREENIAVGAELMDAPATAVASNGGGASSQAKKDSKRGHSRHHHHHHDPHDPHVDPAGSTSRSAGSSERRSRRTAPPLSTSPHPSSHRGNASSGAGGVSGAEGNSGGDSERSQLKHLADAELRMLLSYFFADAQRCAFEALQVLDGDVTTGFPSTPRSSPAPASRCWGEGVGYGVHRHDGAVEGGLFAAADGGSDSGSGGTVTHHIHSGHPSAYGGTPAASAVSDGVEGSGGGGGAPPSSSATRGTTTTTALSPPSSFSTALKAPPHDPQQQTPQQPPQPQDEDFFSDSAVGMDDDYHSGHQTAAERNHSRAEDPAQEALRQEAAVAFQFLISTAFSCPCAFTSAAVQLVLADVNAKRLQLQRQMMAKQPRSTREDSARVRSFSGARGGLDEGASPIIAEGSLRVVPGGEEGSPGKIRNFFSDNKKHLALVTPWVFVVDETVYKHVQDYVTMQKELLSQSAGRPFDGSRSDNASTTSCSADAARLRLFLQMDEVEQCRRIRYAGEVVQLRRSSHEDERGVLLTPRDTLLWVAADGMIHVQTVQSVTVPCIKGGHGVLLHWGKSNNSPDGRPNTTDRGLSSGTTTTTCFTAPRRSSCALPILQYMLLKEESDVAEAMERLAYTALTSMHLQELRRTSSSLEDGLLMRVNRRANPFHEKGVRRQIAVLKALARCNLIPRPPTSLTRRDILYSVFNECGECPSYYELLASTSAAFIAAHHAVQRFLFFHDGPLSIEERLMVAIMTASRHRCTYLVRRYASLLWLYLSRVPDRELPEGCTTWSESETEEGDEEDDDVGGMPFTQGDDVLSRDDTAMEEEEEDEDVPIGRAPQRRAHDHHPDGDADVDFIGSSPASTDDDDPHRGGGGRSGRRRRRRQSAGGRVPLLSTRLTWRQWHQRWLTHGPPKRLRAVQRWIELAARQPWCTTESDVQQCLERGWSVPQMFHLTSLVANVLGLTSLTMGLMVPSEPWTATVLPQALLDRIERASSSPGKGSAALLMPHSVSQYNVLSGDLNSMVSSTHDIGGASTTACLPPENLSLPTGAGSSPSAHQPHLLATPRRSNNEGESDIFVLYAGRDVVPVELRNQCPSNCLLWSSDFDWQETGAAFMEQYYPGMSFLILEEIECWRDAICQLSTADCAGAAPSCMISPEFAFNSLHFYILNLLGYVVSDYQFGEINKVLLRPAKAFAQQMIVKPELLDSSGVLFSGLVETVARMPTATSPVGAPAPFASSSSNEPMNVALLESILSVLTQHMAQEEELRNAGRSAADPGEEDEEDEEDMSEDGKAQSSAADEQEEDDNDNDNDNDNDDETHEESRNEGSRSSGRQRQRPLRTPASAVSTSSLLEDSAVDRRHHHQRPNSTAAVAAALEWLCQRMGATAPSTASAGYTHPDTMVSGDAIKASTVVERELQRWGEDALHCALTLQREKLMVHIATTAMIARRDAILHVLLYCLSSFLHEL